MQHGGLESDTWWFETWLCAVDTTDTWLCVGAICIFLAFYGYARVQKRSAYMPETGGDFPRLTWSDVKSPMSRNFTYR